MKKYVVDSFAPPGKSSLQMLCAATVLAIAPQVQALVVTQGDMNPANWMQATATVSGSNATLNFAAPSAGGSPSSYWENRFTVAELNSGLNQIRKFNIFNAAAYDPATQGALASLVFSYDTRVVSSIFSTAGFLIPGIEQNGHFFRRILGATEVTSSDWQTRTFAAALESEWFELGTNFQPDFSENGSTIHFGYSVTFGTQCPTGFVCTGGSIVSGLDNFRVEALGAGLPGGNNVPEPGSLALALLGLLAMRSQVARRFYGSRDQDLNRSGCFPLNGA